MLSIACIVAADAMVLKYQTISIHDIDSIMILINSFQKEITFVVQTKIFLKEKYLNRDSPTFWHQCAFFSTLPQFYVPFLCEKQKNWSFLCAFWNSNALKD